MFQNAIHSSRFAYCALEPLQNFSAVLHTFIAIASVNFFTVSSSLLVPNMIGALARMYSMAHGHHLKTASYREISLAELEVIELSIVMGIGRKKPVVLKVTLVDAHAMFWLAAKCVNPVR